MVLCMVQLRALGRDLRHPLRRVWAAARPVLPRRGEDAQGPGDLVVKSDQQLRNACLFRINISGFYYLVSSRLSPDSSWCILVCGLEVHQENRFGERDAVSRMVSSTCPRTETGRNGADMNTRSLKVHIP